MKRNILKKILAPLGLVVLAAALWAGDTAIVDGQNAEDVVGQTDASGNGVFTDGTPFDSQRLDGFNLQYDVDVDTVSHRLFVCDDASSRIMVYDLDSNNALVDRAADKVLGQSTFYRTASGATANSLSWPTALHFDAGSNRLFVADNSNNRIVLFDVASITDGENAVNVLGQSNFTSNSAATTASGMKSPQGCVFDGATQRLFVGDTYNHRILVFDLSTVTDGENAVNVLGQSNFTTGTNATTAAGLYYPRRIDYDSANGRLFVADTSNQRVLVFDVTSITDGENAVNVLGQSNFTTSNSGTSSGNFSSPLGVAYGTATQRLYVGDSWNNRVMIFDVAAITDGENAVNVLGQSNFTTHANRTTQDGLYLPRGVFVDDGANRLLVADQYNNRILMFDVSTTTLVDGQNADNVAGQTDGAGGAVFAAGNTYDGAVQKGMNAPYDVAVDTVSHRMFVADYYSNRVLAYNLNTDNVLVDRTPDHVLGQTDFVKTSELSAGANQASLHSLSGLAFDPVRGYLFVVSAGRYRVMVFDVNSITDGENAVNVLGQPNFTSSSPALTASGVNYAFGVDYDVATQKLYLADRSNHRVTVYDVAVITNGENAVNVLGQSDFTTNTVATPPTQASLYYPFDVDVAGDRLYVADDYNHRVMVFDVASITDGENAVNVLGQTTFTTRTSGTTAGAMYNPRSVALDVPGNRLFVSNYSTHRITVYDVAAITDGEDAVNVLGQANFTSSGAQTTQAGYSNPTGLDYEPNTQRLYVADYNNNRVIVQSVGPVSPSTSTVTATAGVNQVTLGWVSAGDDAMTGNLTGTYRVQYATYTAAWSASTTPADATTLTISTASATPGVAISTTVAGLTTGTTYYFALFTADEVPNWSEVSNTTAAVPFAWFDPNPIEVDGPGGGLMQGNVGWGDFDNDGDVDILGVGNNSGDHLRVYKNNGNGTIDPTEVEVDVADGGIHYGQAAWGDFDNDGDLDIVISGYDWTSQRLRIYKNNGNATFDAAQIEVDGATGGLQDGGVAWGDYDNDGDLDILVNGLEGTNRQLRIYKNNGNGTMDSAQIEVDGSNGGLYLGSVAWGDYDKDGDLDILVNGADSSDANQLRVYGNNGNGTINPTQIEVGGAGNGVSASLAWGDYDNDGDMDILASGYGNFARQLRVYKSNGNGTFDPTPIEVDGVGGGVGGGTVAWGDHDNDGDLDILASGIDGGEACQLRVYRNNGNGTLDPAQIEVGGAGNGLVYSGAAWGDYDSDGDLDVLASGGTVSLTKELRVYKNNVAQPNTTPAAPGGHSASFTFNTGSVSVASFTWATGIDSGTGATPENVLTYDLQISTVSNFSSVLFPGQMGATPRMGSYLKPPKIFNGNADYGVMLKSTDPWNVQSTASYGLRTDTTYYYRVKTVDSSLAESSWSNGGNLYTGVAPSTSTLSATSTATDGEVLLAWNSAGDDGMNGNLTGTYRIQYATYTVAWSSSSTPTDATTVTISTTTQVPGSAQSKLITGLTGGLTYYFVLWTADEVPNWATLSNSTSAVPFVSIRSVTIDGLNTLGLGSVDLGDQVVASTGIVVRNDGTLVNKYVLSASTQTVGTSWSVKDSTPAGPDAMVLFGLFDDDTGPVLGDFDVDDVIGTMETGSTSGVFSVDGTTTGASVPAGETRKIWIRLDMPTTSRTESPQTLRIQITAQPP